MGAAVEEEAGAAAKRPRGSRIAEVRQVGRSELRVPVLGLGGSAIGELWDDVAPEDAIQAVLAAHRAGVHHFDTAPWYGNGMSEARMGMALNTVKKRGAPFTLATKVGRTLEPAPKKHDGPWDGPWKGGFDLQVTYDYTYEGILQQHRESCLRMGLPRVDALAIHDLDAKYGGQEVVEKYMAQLAPPGGYRALQELKAKGVIKAIGVGCNDYKFGTREVCQRVAEWGDLDYILIAGPYNLLNQEALDDLLPLCRDRGASAFIGAPLASGILAIGARDGKRPDYMYEPPTEEILTRVRKIQDVCDRHGVLLPAAALQFPIAHPRVACVITGVKSEVEVNRAVEAFEMDIPLAFWRDLKSEGLIRADAPVPGDDVSHL